MGAAVKRMFTQIAPGYDRANTVLSWGQHHRWRRRAVDLAQPPRGGDILDVATGTGDLALEFRRRMKGGKVVGVDFAPAMLERARDKAKNAGLKIDFQEGDALDLPFEKGQFDVASIAFGVRNVDDPAACLRELARVVRPGGRVVVLEFGQPSGMIRWPYEAYSRLILPLVGGLMTGQRQAYTYLQRTSSRFHAGDQFLDLMTSTDAFVATRAVPLSSGIAYCYVGVVAPAA